MIAYCQNPLGGRRAPPWGRTLIRALGVPLIILFKFYLTNCKLVIKSRLRPIANLCAINPMCMINKYDLLTKI